MLNQNKSINSPKSSFSLASQYPPLYSYSFNPDIGSIVSLNHFGLCSIFLLSFNFLAALCFSSNL